MTNIIHRRLTRFGGAAVLVHDMVIAGASAWVVADEKVSDFSIAVVYKKFEIVLSGGLCVFLYYIP